MLDHHYAEWQHDHGHVFFGGAAGDSGFHVHIYDNSEGHGHTPVTDSPVSRSVPEGVAYFSSFDGAGSGPVSSPTGPSTDALTFPDPGDQPLLAAYGGAELPRAGVHVAPPRKPPAL